MNIRSRISKSTHVVRRHGEEIVAHGEVVEVTAVGRGRIAVVAWDNGTRERFSFGAVIEIESGRSSVEIRNG